MLHMIESGKKIERNYSERVEMAGGTIKATTYGKIVPKDNRIKTEPGEYLKTGLIHSF